VTMEATIETENQTCGVETTQASLKDIEQRIHEELTASGCSQQDIDAYRERHPWKTLDELTVSQLQALVFDTGESASLRNATRSVLNNKQAEKRRLRNESLVAASKRHRELQAADKYPTELYFPSELENFIPEADIFWDLKSNQYVYRKKDGYWYFNNYYSLLQSWSETQLKKAKEQPVVYAGPLAGWDTAYLRIAENTTLIAMGERHLLDYETADEDYTDEKWSHIRQFLSDALGDQFGTFRQWCISAMNPMLYCDRTLVLTGDHKAAETLQRVITLLTSNRQKNAEAYLTGASKHYNVDLIGSEHLVYNGPITLKVSRMLKKFWTSRRDVYVPGGKVSFTVPKLWQRVSIITDEETVRRLRESADMYIVLKLNPAKLTATQLDREIDYFGLAAASQLGEEQPEQTPAYWYQDAESTKVDGWDLLEAIDALPANWEGTGGAFVETTMCPKSAKVIGRQLKAVADKRELLTWRRLDGERLYKKVGR
jgi:hypothetical protein